jgi:hypothetical protein
LELGQETEDNEEPWEWCGLVFLVVVGLEADFVEVVMVLGDAPGGEPPPVLPPALQFVVYDPNGATGNIGAGLVSTIGLHPGKFFPGLSTFS